MFGHFHSSQSRFYCPLYLPDEGAASELPIHPYNLGVLIGDGALTTTNPSFTSIDEEIVNNFKNNLPSDVVLIPRTKIMYGISKINNRYDGKVNTYTFHLRNLNLYGKGSGDKFIPPEYLTASLNQRLELLKGLMDTDGTIDKGGHCSYTSISYRLIRDVQRLIWSIGGIAAISSRYCSYSKNGVKHTGKLAYTLRIRVKDQSQLFKLPRKLARAKVTNQYSDRLKNRIVHVNLAEGIELPEYDQYICVA